MKSYCKKLLAVALSAAIVMSAASCNTKKNDGNGSHSGMKIAQDTPWYESKEYPVDLGLDKNREIAYCYYKYVGGDDKNFYVLTEGSYKHPGQDFMEAEDWIWNVSMVDRNTGETVKVMDLMKILPENYNPNSVMYRNGSIDVTTDTWNKQKKESETWDFKIDPGTEKITDKELLEDAFYGKESKELGGYRVESFSQADKNNENLYYVLDIFAPDGSTKRVELKEDGRDFYSAPVFIPMGKTEALVYVMLEMEELYYKLDLETGKLTKENAKDYDWLNMSFMAEPVTGSDGNAYLSQDNGIAKFNFDKKCIEDVLNYSWCDVAKSKLSGLLLLDITDDTILMSRENMGYGKFGYFYGESLKEYSLLLLTKAKTNPHAGKQILEMYAPYCDVNDAVYNKVVEFNNTNGKYFIEITDRYTKEYDAAFTDNVEDSSKAILEGESLMGNKLAMDIMNGNGPDLFYDPSYFGSLNYKEHLVDLTPYVGELEKDKYFTNVVDLSKNDGKLYVLPITVRACGVLTDAKYAGSSGVGFTTEEYEKFLKETLNGNDIIDGTQPYYFVELFNAMRGRFIKDGKADFTGEDFAVLAKFVKDNAPEKELPEYIPEDGEDYNPQDDWHSLKPAVLSGAGSYNWFFEEAERVIGDAALLGVPTPDGSGPIAGAGITVAVSAHAADVAVCCEFVKSLLTDDVQNELAQHGSFPLNREIFRNVGYEAVDYFNTVSVNANFDPDGTVAKNRVTFTKDYIDMVEKAISSATEIKQYDPDIEKILVEEMPAYFSGQKSLDEVVKIAQDRVQKVLGERG